LSETPDPTNPPSGQDEAGRTHDGLVESFDGERNEAASISLSIDVMNEWLRKAEKSYQSGSHDAAIAAAQIATAHAQAVQARLARRIS
jgi:hypothetical protein